MLTIEYLPDFDLHLVIPVNHITKRECQHTEYVFNTASEAKTFCKDWHKNPVDAGFKYYQRELKQLTKG